MKPEVAYLKNLLQGFRDAPGTTTNIQELKADGLDYYDPKFEFHLRLLADDQYVESADTRGLFLFFELQDHLFRAIVAGIEFHGFLIRQNGLMGISNIGVAFA